MHASRRDLSFSFLAADEIEATPAPGYDAGAIHELIYTARDPVVARLSLASVRDVVAHLRSGRTGDGLANPLAKDGKPTVDRATGFGVSQSGRFIKELLYRGFHVDEESDLRAVRAAMERLVADRLMLGADAIMLVTAAEQRQLAGLP